MSEETKRTETIEEYIKRGGTITRLPDSPNSFYAVEFEKSTATTKSNPLKENLEIYKRVSWKDIEHDDSIVETDDQYWKEVDRAVDKLMSKYS